MKTIYLIYADKDVDGGFGDAVGIKEVVCAFVSKEKAIDYVSKNSNPHIYDKPYACLYTGGLHIEETELKEM